MASSNGSVATEGTLRAPILAPSAILPPTQNDSSLDDPSRKSLKRARETTPTSPASVPGVADLSPSKIARLVGFTRSALPPLTGVAALEDERRQREEELRQHPPGTSENPSRKVLEAMTAPVVEMSRPEDAPVLDATRPKLSPVTIPSTNVIPASMDDTSPRSAHTTQTSVSAGGVPVNVVDSPVPMDVDSNNDRLYPQQPEAPMDDKTAATSLSYPGLAPAGAMGAPATPQRGMSLPLGEPQEGDSLRPTPGKKHKCQYCDTEFTRHHNLKSHLLTHSQEKPYVCQTCNLRFRRLHDLKRHSKLHTGEKPHVCPKCDRKFARGDALARHSKGAGGCAGRRSSMGSFGGDDDYEGGGMDDSGMPGVVYGSEMEGMSEEERRRLSMPTIRTQPVSHIPEGYTTHSSTYPPAGPRPGASSSLYPPVLEPAASSSGTSTGGPSGHTPHTSVSSLPLSATSSTNFAPSAVTESPKPLSPTGTRNRSPSASHGRLGEASASSHGKTTSQAPARSAWLNAYPPTNGNPTEGNAASWAAPPKPAAPLAAVAKGRTGTDANFFAAGEQDIWAHIQHMDETIKILTMHVETGMRTETQLLERLSTAEKRVDALASEVDGLRQQLAAAAATAVAVSGPVAPQ